jgi:hypothetical protein
MPCIEVRESDALPLWNGSMTTSPTAMVASTSASSLRRKRVCLRLDIFPTVPAHVSCGRYHNAVAVNRASLTGLANRQAAKIFCISSCLRTSTPVFSWSLLLRRTAASGNRLRR